ncbi:hypothetical protein Bca101_088924 [Brassica carinata]
MHYIPISFTNQPPNKKIPLCILLIKFNCKSIKTYFRKKSQDGDHNLQNARRQVTIGLRRRTVAMEKLQERGAGGSGGGAELRERRVAEELRVSRGSFYQFFFN